MFIFGTPTRMGRNRIVIQPLTNERNRQSTFSKRKQGLFKKAMELSILCGCDVSLVIVCDGKLYDYSSANLPQLLQKYSTFDKIHETYTNNDYDEMFTSKDKKSHISPKNGTTKTSPATDKLMVHPVPQQSSLQKVPPMRHNQQSLYGQINPDIRTNNQRYHMASQFANYQRPYTDRMPQLHRPMSHQLPPSKSRHNAFTPTTEGRYAAAQQLYGVTESGSLNSSLGRVVPPPSHGHPPPRIHQSGNSKQLYSSGNNALSGVPRMVHPPNILDPIPKSTNSNRKRKPCLNLKITVPVPTNIRNRVPVRVKSEPGDRSDVPVVDGNMSAMFPSICPTLNILAPVHGIEVSPLPVTPSSSKIEGLVWTPTPKAPTDKGLLAEYCIEHRSRKIQKSSHGHTYPDASQRTL